MILDERERERGRYYLEKNCFDYKNLKTFM